MLMREAWPGPQLRASQTPCGYGTGFLRGCTGFLRKEAEPVETRDKGQPRAGRGAQEELLGASAGQRAGHHTPPRRRSCLWVPQMVGAVLSLHSGLGPDKVGAGDPGRRGDGEPKSLFPMSTLGHCAGLRAPPRLGTRVLPSTGPAQTCLRTVLNKCGT